MRNHTNSRIKNYHTCFYFCLECWRTNHPWIIIRNTKPYDRCRHRLLIDLFRRRSFPCLCLLIYWHRQRRVTNLKSLLKIILETPNIKKTIGVTTLFFFGLFLINLANETFLGNPTSYFLLLFTVIPLGRGLEEVSWCGFLQSLLEKKFSFIYTSLLIGVIWGLWHLSL